MLVGKQPCNKGDEQHVLREELWLDVTGYKDVSSKVLVSWKLKHTMKNLTDPVAKGIFVKVCVLIKNMHWEQKLPGGKDG